MYHTDKKQVNYTAFFSNLDMGNLSGTHQPLQDLYLIHIWIYSDELQSKVDKMLPEFYNFCIISH